MFEYPPARRRLRVVQYDVRHVFPGDAPLVLDQGNQFAPAINVAAFIVALHAGHPTVAEHAQPADPAWLFRGHIFGPLASEMVFHAHVPCGQCQRQQLAARPTPTVQVRAARFGGAGTPSGMYLCLAPHLLALASNGRQ